MNSPLMFSLIPTRLMRAVYQINIRSLKLWSSSEIFDLKLLDFKTVHTKQIIKKKLFTDFHSKIGTRDYLDNADYVFLLQDIEEDSGWNSVPENS